MALLRALAQRWPLLVLLARKEFHVRYRRASFGTLWAVLIPLVQSAMMAVVFSRVAKLNLPHYPIYMLTGMVAWTYFSAVLNGGGTAIVDNADLSSRVYFPRVLLPLVSVASNLYGLVIMLVIMLGLCPILGVHLGKAVVLLVPAVALMVAFAAGLTMVSSALHVYFRDIRYIITASLLLLLYGSPVIYAPDSFHSSLLRSLLTANPLTGIIDLFHASTVGAGGPMAAALAVSCAWTAGLLAVGIALQSRFDRVFADLL